MVILESFNVLAVSCDVCLSDVVQNVAVILVIDDVV